jgi:hypothetical protein
MKKVLVPKEALEKFVEIAQDNLDEKRVLRNELQWPMAGHQTAHIAPLPWPCSLARQPCRNYAVLIYCKLSCGRRPAVYCMLSPQLTRHCDFEPCVQIDIAF